MADFQGIQLLQWDTDFFGVRIARLVENNLTPDTITAVDNECRRQEVDCLHYLVDPGDSATVRLAEDHGFHLVDIRITLERAIAPTPGEWQANAPNIRLATCSDIPQLRPIAAVNHRDSRFYHDGGLSQARCDELYAVWIEKSCQGFADAVLVAELDGHAVGYLSCHLREQQTGQIGLVGVSSAFQGEGLGRQLLAESIHWFTAAGVNRVEVVTQGRNLAAQRLYQKSNFLTCKLQLWYHKWFRCTAKSI